MQEALIQAEAFGMKSVSFNWGSPFEDEVKRGQTTFDLNLCEDSDSDTDEDKFQTEQIEPKNMIAPTCGVWIIPI